MDKRLKTAFTLIELLVVIAIVGILSGLIIVGMSSSVDSARIAKAQIFSASLRDSLLMSLVSEWKFDELTTATEGQSIQDTWSANNCTLYTGTDGLDKIRTGSNCVYGKCLAFDGTNDYLNCGNGSNLNISTSITVSAWIKTTSSATQIMLEKITGTTTDGYSLLSVSGQLGGRLYPNPISSTTLINDNKWHYVIMSDENVANGWDLYVDGVNVKQQAGVAILPNSNPLYVAIRGGSTLPYSGSIDDIRIYNASVPSSWVREGYYAGLNRLLKNSSITRVEYEKRLEELINKLAKK